LMIDRHLSNQPTASLQTSICFYVTVNDRIQVIGESTASLQAI